MKMRAQIDATRLRAGKGRTPLAQRAHLGACTLATASQDSDRILLRRRVARTRHVAKQIVLRLPELPDRAGHRRDEAPANECRVAIVRRGIDYLQNNTSCII